MKVDIKWKVEGSEKHGELNFEDQVDGGNSSPNYWYFHGISRPALPL
jgi:hypothetical protein